MTLELSGGAAVRLNEMLDIARGILRRAPLCNLSTRGRKLCYDTGKLHIRLFGFCDQGREFILGPEDRERKEKPQNGENKEKENNDQAEYAGKHVHVNAPCDA
jgi:hypothetical protein